MFAMIILGILGLAALVGLGITIVSKEAKGIGAAVLAGSIVLGLIVGFFSMAVTNDEGQAKVLRS